MLLDHVFWSTSHSCDRVFQKLKIKGQDQSGFNILSIRISFIPSQPCHSWDTAISKSVWKSKSWVRLKFKVNLNRSIEFSQRLPQKSGWIWKFHKYYPKRVARNEKMIPNRSMFDIWIPNQSVPEVKKRGVKGRHINTLTRLSFHAIRQSHSWDINATPEMRSFQNLTLKVQRQGHGWGQASRSHDGSNIFFTHTPFIPCQSCSPPIPWIRICH